MNKASATLAPPLSLSTHLSSASDGEDDQRCWYFWSVQSLLHEREALLRDQIESANVRLAEYGEAIREQGATVIGSRGQVRPHPLIRAETELRRERMHALDELEDVLRRLDTERTLQEANRLTAWLAEPASP